MPYQVDGDHLGQADVLELVHRPDAVRLVVPLPEDRVDRVDRVRGG
jgi:hypothetical protein